MTDLPSHTQFEYLWVQLEEPFGWVVEVRPFVCTGVDEETDSYIWQPDVEAIMRFKTEEDALAYINRIGVLAESFKNKLN